MPSAINRSREKKLKFDNINSNKTYNNGFFCDIHYSSQIILIFLILFSQYSWVVYIVNLFFFKLRKLTEK